MPKSHEVNRRDFVKVVTAFLGSIIGAVIGIPAIGYLIGPAVKASQSEAWIPLGPLENYPPGVPTLFSFVRTKINGWEKSSNSYGVYVVRGEDQEVRVFSNICTHLNCRVKWLEDEQGYRCPCHDAVFGKYGEVKSGPPPRPLDEYQTKVEDGNLFIFFQEG